MDWVKDLINDLEIVMHLEAFHLTLETGYQRPCTRKDRMKRLESKRMIRTAPTSHHIRALDPSYSVQGLRQELAIAHSSAV